MSIIPSSGVKCHLGGFFMSKRNRSFTATKMKKWLKEGRGQGIAKEYKPWITIQDVPSKGNRTRLKGIKSARTHHFLSNLERDYFYITEFSDSVKDIREQFPLLPLEQTIAIAEENGIEHPTDPETKEPVVITTDFLLTVETNGSIEDVARTIKQKKDLLDPRVIEKFEIERRYWAMKDISWGIVTEQNINKILADNLHIVYRDYDLTFNSGLIDIDTKLRKKLINQLIRKLCTENVNVFAITTEFDDLMGIEPGTGLSIFKHLVITKQINLDLFTKKLDFYNPMNIDLLDLRVDDEVDAV